MEPVRVAKLDTSAAVRCLDCTLVYTKPVGGGTISTNPGCPHCGYVGWVAASVLSEMPSRARFGAGRPRLPSARRR